jgi:3-mercaptopropionate dioxygenase
VKREALEGAFAQFLDAMDAIVGVEMSESRRFEAGKKALQPLLANDAWLPTDFQTSRPDKYQQFALYVDPEARYSVVSFVWGPGQSTPVHDHTVWGMVGVLRGAEACEEFAVGHDRALKKTHSHRLPHGDIDCVSPTIGDIHRVSNASATETAISIHVYGADIGRVSRHVFDDKGQAQAFVSGYSNDAPWITP